MSRSDLIEWLTTPSPAVLAALLSVFIGRVLPDLCFGIDMGPVCGSILASLSALSIARVGFRTARLARSQGVLPEEFDRNYLSIFVPQLHRIGGASAISVLGYDASLSNPVAGILIAGAAVVYLFSSGDQ